MNLPRVTAIVFASLLVADARAVQTQFLTVNGRAAFEGGTLDHVVVAPGGGVRLAREFKTIVEDDGKSASIDAIIETADGTVYLGTNAQGRLIAVRDGKPTTIAEFGEGGAVSALALDAGGDLLVGVGGEHASLHRLKRGEQKLAKVCDLDDAQYVWSIAITPDGTALVATGPTGKLFGVDLKAATARVIFDSDEDNLRCVAAQNDAIYVGTDPHGLVLKIDRATGNAFVVHDAAETEVSAIAIDDRNGSLYVGTSQPVEPPAEGASDAKPESGGGKPEDAATLPMETPKEPKPPGNEKRPGELADAPGDVEPPAMPGATSRPAAGGNAPAGPRPMTPKAEGELAANGNAVYRIDSQGFASELFRAPVMVFALARQGDALLVATGPQGTLYHVDLASEEHAVIAVAEVEALTSVTVARDGTAWIGTGNGATLATLSADVAKSGTFTSAVLDASQVASFGKLQVRGAVPEGAAMTVSVRSSNVADGDSPLWSAWSEPQPAARFVVTTTPAARYAQVRVTLTGDGKGAVPTLDELKLAYQRPNVAPRIETVGIITPPTEGDATEQPMRTIDWQAADANGDAMRFEVAARTNGGPWVTIARDINDATYSWDTRRLPDGRYEVRVTASDALSNPEGTGQTASRSADAVDIDNTPPAIGDVKEERANGKLTVSCRVADRSGVVARLEYRLDDAKDWQTAAASDNLDDSPDERYAIVLPDPGAATRVLSLRGRDASGNMAYASVTLRPEK